MFRSHARLFSALLVSAFALVLVLSIVPLQAHATTSVAFKQVSYITPSVQGIPDSVTWGVCIGATTYSSCGSDGGTIHTGTGPSITVTGLSGTETFSYESLVTGATGVEYQCYTGACAGTLTTSTTSESASYLPYYQVSFAASPAGSGTVSPTTATFYYQTQQVYVYATPNPGYLFSSFSSTNSSNTSSTPVPDGAFTFATFTINGPGTITANFVAGTYSMTFKQLNWEAQTSVGVASGLTWSVCTDNTGITSYSSCQSGGGTVSSGTGSTITVSGLSGVTSYSYVSLVPGATTNTEYSCYNGCTGQLSYAGTETAYYLTYFEVTFAVSPTGSGTLSPDTPTFYYQTDEVGLFATPNTGYLFSSYSSNTSAITFGSTSPYGAGETYAVATITGPGMITANFVAGTYSVTFKQLNWENTAVVGVASGLTWSVCTDSTGITTYSSCQSGGGTVSSGTGSSITVSGLSGVTSYSYVPMVAGATSNTYYSCYTGCSGTASSTTTETAYYLTYFEVTFAVSPTGSGTLSPDTPTFYYQNEGVGLFALPTAGYLFSSYSSNTSAITFGSTSPYGAGYTYAVATITGPGMITANFVAGTYSMTFDQLNWENTAVAGVPSGLTWSVCTDNTGITTYSSCQSGGGTVSSGTGSSITVTGLSGVTSYSYVSTVAGATSKTYYSCYTGCSGTASSTTTETAYYLTYFEVTFAVSPTGSGTLSPDTPTFYYQNEGVGLFATPNTGYTFSSYSSNTSAITIGSTSPYSTDTTYAVATITGPGMITANFLGVPYTVTFHQTGIPGSVTWGVTVGGTDHTGTGSNITLIGITGVQSYSFDSPVAGATGVQYVSTCSGSVSGAGTQSCGYATQYQVSFVVNPNGSGMTSPSTTAYYAAGFGLPITATANSGYAFSSWSNGSSSISFVSRTSSSTSAQINGPGTITADFASTNYAVTFDQSGIPTSGVTWGVTIDGIHHTGTGASITVTGLGGALAFTYDTPVSGAPGVQYLCSTGCSGSVLGAATESAAYTTQSTSTSTSTSASTSSSSSTSTSSSSSTSTSTTSISTSTSSTSTSASTSSSSSTSTSSSSSTSTSTTSISTSSSTGTTSTGTTSSTSTSMSTASTSTSMSTASTSTSTSTGTTSTSTSTTTVPTGVPQFPIGMLPLVVFSLVGILFLRRKLVKPTL